MPIEDLVSRLESLDIRLQTEGEKLLVSAPSGALTTELKAEIASRKQELLAVLRDSVELAFDPADAATLEDPYPYYASLREHDPVHRSPAGPWVITRYDDVLQALGDGRLLNAPAPYATVNRRNEDRYISAAIANNILPFLDPPRHTPLRQTISRTFRNQLRRHPPNVRGIANRLLDTCRAKGEIDLVHEFGRPLSASVFGELLGVPEGDRHQLVRWSELFFYLFVPIASTKVLADMEKGLGEFRDYFARLIEQRRRSPGLDLISALVSDAGGGRTFTDMELTDTCMLLFSDGVENIDSAIGNGIVAMLAHPDQLRLLKERPELMGTAAEECLRFDAPSQFIARIAREDIEIGGSSIREGEALLLVLASANRDPSRFSEPDRLDVERAENPHLTFGRGHHFCIGAQIVREHVREGLGAILEKLADLELAEARIRRANRPGHRWLDGLPVTFAPY